MSSKSVKLRLVEYMMENGNNFTYTEMVKALLLITKGPNYKYNWQHDRGYYATNLSFRGYITNGGGSCGVYKNDQGKWSAKMYTKDEMISYKIDKIVSTIVNLIKRASGDLYWDRKAVMDIEDLYTRHKVLTRTMANYSSEVDRFKKNCIKNITKQLKTIK